MLGLGGGFKRGVLAVGRGGEHARGGVAVRLRVVAWIGV